MIHVNSIGTQQGNQLWNDLSEALTKIRMKLTQCNGRWWYDRSECKKEREPAAKSELSLSHVAGIFYILICGLILAMVEPRHCHSFCSSKSMNIHNPERASRVYFGPVPLEARSGSVEPGSQKLDTLKMVATARSWQLEDEKWA